MRFDEIWILRFGDVWNGFRVVLDGDLRGKMRVDESEVMCCFGVGFLGIKRELREVL